MNTSQIPWEAFQNYIHNRLQSQKRMNAEEIAQILTAIRGLKSLSEEKLDDTERTANIVQMILIVLFFTDRNKSLGSVSTIELRGLNTTICENVRNNLMTVDDIPWKAFRDYIHEHLEGLNVVETPNIPLIMGSIGDLKQLSLEQPDNTERLTNLINVVTVLLLLMEKG